MLRGMDADLDSIVIAFDGPARAALPVIMALIMVSVALSLKIGDFRTVAAAPVRFIGAAAAQILVLPLLTLLIILAFEPRPSIALGMIVVACCPGGNVSNFLTHLARGDTALSVSLTTTSSLLAALATPVSILFWAGLHPPTAGILDALDVSPLPFIATTVMLLALPLAAGMAFAHRFPQAAARIRPAMTIASLGALIALIGFNLQANAGLLAMAALMVLPWVAGHNAAALGLGWLSGRALGFQAAGRRAMTFEVGIQNAGLGLVILLSQFGGLGGAAAVTALWGVCHLITGLGLAALFRLCGCQAAAPAGAAM